MAAQWEVRRFDRTAAPSPALRGRVRVVLDNIRSAYNVGSILRTSEAAGVEHLHLCGISATPDNPKVVKTALGAERMVAWSHHIATADVLEELRAQGWTLIAVELTDRGALHCAYSYPEKCALVFGHEVAGVPPALLARCDAVVEIPMLGRKNSLNVATSVGIVLFEIVRRRLGADAGDPGPRAGMPETPRSPEPPR
jgi:23S rRNA (guanosine2251-2'-O)-methyltransferase